MEGGERWSRAQPGAMGWDWVMEIAADVQLGMEAKEGMLPTGCSCPVAKPPPPHTALSVHPPPISVLLHLADQGRDRKRTRFWKRRRRRPTAHRPELSGAKP